MSNLDELQRKWLQFWSKEGPNLWGSVLDLLRGDIEYIQQGLSLLESLDAIESICLLFQKNGKGTLGWKERFLRSDASGVLLQSMLMDHLVQASPESVLHQLLNEGELDDWLFMNFR